MAEARARVVGAIDAERLIRRLRMMVQTRSYSNTPGEGDLARKLAAELEPQGLEVRLHPVMHERLNTVAWLRGAAEGPSLMLNGHIDTNMAGEGWTRDPFGADIENGCIYGIGVSNMKAADAAIIEAISAVQQSGVRTAGDVCLAMVVGELQGGIGTLSLLDDGVRCDYFLVGEPTDLSALTLHAGAFEFIVHVIGRTRHLSKMEEAASAIDKMFDVIQELKDIRFSGAERADYAGLQRLNVGVIRGGMTREYLEWRTPQVPDFCTIRVAGRIAPSQTPQSAIADVRAVLRERQRRDPDLQFEIEMAPMGVGGHMPAFEIDPRHPFVRRLVSCHIEATGH
jgi:acetylornithine deacetylase